VDRVWFIEFSVFANVRPLSRILRANDEIHMADILFPSDIWSWIGFVKANDHVLLGSTITQSLTSVGRHITSTSPDALWRCLPIPELRNTLHRHSTMGGGRAMSLVIDCPWVRNRHCGRTETTCARDEHSFPVIIASWMSRSL
jgi:hypothetical protein